ncbi:di-heme cytochrome c peroxidase family protein [Collimonas arenae]|uniref:Di-heme cytochrome c peroxidase family protein n=1 Tax=Collimonas arenae TaxID=279058 RepID=A0A127QD26_9BURK|nr:di-heme cytochrome c peroxidase family protein [Collimonas arenae]
MLSFNQGRLLDYQWGAGLVALVSVVLLAGCHDGDTPARAAAKAGPASVAAAPAAASAPADKKPSLKMWVRYPEPPATLSAAATLGKQLFFDASLSASGKMSCATCHSPDHAYGPPNGLAVQLGGADMQRQGTRGVPSLRYLGFTPKFTRHYYVPGPDETEDEGPTGGFTHDGAVDSLHEQALIPLLNPNEMANANPAEIAAKLQKTSYVEQFRQVYGAGIFDHPEAAVEKATLALEAFQTEDPSFHPYTSKFDAAMAGNADFTPAELRGYGLFNNPNKGNCAKCHVDTRGRAAGRRSSPISVSRHWVCRAIRRSPRIAIRSISISAFAARTARTWRRKANSAACSSHRPCVMSPRAARSFTTAASIRWKTCCISMSSAIPIRPSGTRRSKVKWPSSTICRHATAPISIRWMRRSTARQATSPP